MADQPADLLNQPGLRDKLAPFAESLTQALTTEFHGREHGRAREWDQAMAQLPAVDEVVFSIENGAVSLQTQRDVNTDALRVTLQQFMPWRKGPWQLFGVEIDTEWRSDWKWQRITPHITPLRGRDVLDIGCGNGYHLMRMLDDEASMALGIDPTRLFLYQFQIIKRYLPDLPVHLLPLRGEHLPAFGSFDSVFSLGVLYHRRSPVDHLTELLGFLRPGGELVLETLVVPGDAQTLLIPEDRYAKMANVWFLPSAALLETLLRRAGFTRIRTVDINQTSLDEQRRTDWMSFHSLADFLDPDDINKTAEGHPAPRRALVIAERPDAQTSKRRGAGKGQ